MKYICTVILMLIPLGFVQAQDSSAKQVEAQTSTLIFVRHAEKADDGTNDPSLRNEGRERAEKLAKMLYSEYDISSVYSTSYKRTMETARPLADTLGIVTQIYGFDKLPELLSSMIEQSKGTATLVVGHSNTTPMLVNMLLGSKKYEQLSEDEYGTYFTVTVHTNGAITDQKRSY